MSFKLTWYRFMLLFPWILFIYAVFICFNCVFTSMASLSCPVQTYETIEELLEYPDIAAYTLRNLIGHAILSSSPPGSSKRRLFDRVLESDGLLPFASIRDDAIYEMIAKGEAVLIAADGMFEPTLHQIYSLHPDRWAQKFRILKEPFLEILNSVMGLSKRWPPSRLEQFNQHIGWYLSVGIIQDSYTKIMENAFKCYQSKPKATLKGSLESVSFEDLASVLGLLCLMYMLAAVNVVASSAHRAMLSRSIVSA